MDRHLRLLRSKLGIFIFLFLISSDQSSLYSQMHPAGDVLCNEDHWINKLEQNKYKIITSSILNSSDVITYYPENMIDNNISTCWCSKSRKDGKYNPGDDGSYEFIIIKIPKGAKGFKIVNGNAKSKELYFENNRVKQIYWALITENLEKKRFMSHDSCLEDKPKNFIRKYTTYFQTISVDEVRLKETINPQEILFSYIKEFSWDSVAFQKSKVIYLQISITDIYPGTKYNNTCISEIEIIK
jgi:hypothetical protein